MENRTQYLLTSHPRRKGTLTLNRSLGWALERALSGDGEEKGKLRIRPDEDNCVHHHTNKGNFVGKGSGMIQQKSNHTLHAHISKVKESSGEALSGSQGSSGGDLEKSVDSTSPGRAWVWFPSVHDLKNHYVRILETQIYLFRLDSGPWYTTCESQFYRYVFRI